MFAGWTQCVRARECMCARRHFLLSLRHTTHVETDKTRDGGSVRR